MNQIIGVMNLPSALRDDHLGAGLVELLPHLLVLQDGLDAGQTGRHELVDGRRRRMLMVIVVMHHGETVLVVLLERVMNVAVVRMHGRRMLDGHHHRIGICTHECDETVVDG